MTIERYYRQTTRSNRRHGLLAMTFLGLFVVLSMPQGTIGLDMTAPNTVPSSASSATGSNASGGSTASAGSPALAGIVVSALSQKVEGSTILHSVVKQPFSGLRSSHVRLLKKKNPSAFLPLITLDTSSGSSDSIVKSTSKSTGISQLAVIIIAVGAGIFGLTILLLCCYCMSAQRGKRMRRRLLAKKYSDDTPPLQMGSGADETSTVMEGPYPTPTHQQQQQQQQHQTMEQGFNESIAGYGDQSTVMNYNHSQANRGPDGDTSATHSRGEFDVDKQGNVEVTPRAADAGGAAATGHSFADTDDDFEEHSQREPSNNSNNNKEERIDVYAPPGKLGLVIDTPDGGAPVVHAVKDSSVIADKLQVGDKLVAVDDKDVSAMSAVNISKLISKKSANKTRKLSVLRED